jgi:hypothetical protein
MQPYSPVEVYEFIGKVALDLPLDLDPAAPPAMAGCSWRPAVPTCRRSWSAQCTGTTTSPTLTTVRRDVTAVGRHTIDLLVDVLDGRTTEPASARAPAELVVRESSTPPTR